MLAHVALQLKALFYLRSFSLTPSFSHFVLSGYAAVVAEERVTMVEIAGGEYPNIYVVPCESIWVLCFAVCSERGFLARGVAFVNLTVVWPR